MSDGILLGPAALIKAIAPQYIPTNTSGDPTAPGYYVKDKFCTHQGKFYKCLATTYGMFDPTKWAETTVDANFGTGDDFTGATAQAAGTHGMVPAPATGDQGKFLKGDGTWANVPDPQTMTGATSSAAGTGGLVPAPSAGDQMKVLMGGGTWENAPGGKLYTREFTITNTSGSYTHTFLDENFATDMEAVRLEVNREYVFGATIYFTCGDGHVTVECADVSGTDTIKVGFLKVVADPSAMTSIEYTILSNKIGKDLTAQTLAAGSTTLTFQDSSITTDSTIVPYASAYGVAPRDITVTTGQAVLTFDPQESAISVYLRVW